MKSVKVMFENGDYIVTSINGTWEEIVSYYLGRTCNIGSVEDNMQKCVMIKEA